MSAGIAQFQRVLRDETHFQPYVERRKDPAMLPFGRPSLTSIFWGAHHLQEKVEQRFVQISPLKKEVFDRMGGVELQLRPPSALVFHGDRNKNTNGSYKALQGFEDHPLFVTTPVERHYLDNRSSYTDIGLSRAEFTFPVASLIQGEGRMLEKVYVKDTSTDKIYCFRIIPTSDHELGETYEEAALRAHYLVWRAVWEEPSLVKKMNYILSRLDIGSSLLAHRWVRERFGVPKGTTLEAAMDRALMMHPHYGNADDGDLTSDTAPGASSSKRKISPLTGRARRGKHRSIVRVGMVAGLDKACMRVMKAGDLMPSGTVRIMTFPGHRHEPIVPVVMLYKLPGSNQGKIVPPACDAGERKNPTSIYSCFGKNSEYLEGHVLGFPISFFFSQETGKVMDPSRRAALWFDGVDAEFEVALIGAAGQKDDLKTLGAQLAYMMMEAYTKSPKRYEAVLPYLRKLKGEIEGLQQRFCKEFGCIFVLPDPPAGDALASTEEGEDRGEKLDLHAVEEEAPKEEGTPEQSRVAYTPQSSSHWKQQRAVAIALGMHLPSTIKRKNWPRTVGHPYLPKE